jgi:NTP pyrophosphatase (non-canonical NTP hydrolase)
MSETMTAFDSSNPLLAVDAIGEASHAIAFSDTREIAGKWQLSLSDSTQSILGALMHCPPHSTNWATDYLAHRKIHPAAPGMAPAAAWFELRVAPHDSPLIEIEKLRGRVLRYQEGLPDNSARKEIVEHLDGIQDAIDAIHVALRTHADADVWSHDLVAHEREQPRPYHSLADAVKARQSEWDSDGKLSLIYHVLELVGEAGELANDIKKLEREHLGLPGSRTTRQAVLDELADVHICLHLVANKLGVADLEAITRAKFNATSAKLNLTTKLYEPHAAPSFLPERQRTHGDFRDVSACAQQFKVFCRAFPSWSRMTDAQKEGAEMILHKVCRALSGDPHFKEHWDDIAGYAIRVAENCSEKAV